MELLDVKPVAGVEIEIGLLQATWQDSTRTWRDNLGEVADDAIVWQPHPEGHSIGAVLMHMIAVETRWIVMHVLHEAVDEEHPAVKFGKTVNQEAGKWPAPPARPLAWYYQLQDANRIEVFRHIDSVGDPTVVRERPGKFNFTLRWAMAHLVEHDSYHGGQLVLLKDLWLHRQS